MDHILECPSHVELLQLNNGQLVKDRSELLFNHIETCEWCSGIYGNLKDRPDNFLRKLAQITEEDLTKAQQAIKRHRLMNNRRLHCEDMAECPMPHEQQSATRIRKRHDESEHDVSSSQ